MIWTLITLLVAAWIIGLIAHVGGDMIHFLLGAAVLLFIVTLFMRTRVRV